MKACWNCLFGVGDGDPTMGFESLTWDCEHPKLRFSVAYERFADLVGDTADWDPCKMPSKCGVYEPLFVAACAQCHAEINQPEWSWKYWANVPLPVPVCSEECRQKALDNYDPSQDQHHHHDHFCDGHH